MSISSVATAGSTSVALTAPGIVPDQNSSEMRKSHRCSCLGTGISHVAAFVFSLIPGYSFYQTKKMEARITQLREDKKDLIEIINSLKTRISFLEPKLSTTETELQEVSAAKKGLEEKLFIQGNELQSAKKKIETSLAQEKSSQNDLEAYKKSDSVLKNKLKEQQDVIDEHIRDSQEFCVEMGRLNAKIDSQKDEIQELQRKLNINRGANKNG
jgi:chromosome segregation ATPase